MPQIIFLNLPADSAPHRVKLHVVGINRDAVTIKQVELRTIEEAFDANT
jgi:hypothetical protein